jgi:peptide deformylase
MEYPCFMEIRGIKVYPNPVLRKSCMPIQGITSYEERLFEDMLWIMRLLRGIGLAAPQIGISKQLVVVDIGQGEIKLANPEILKSEGSDKMIEGCLSIPGAEVEVERAFRVTVKGLNEKGEFVEISASGLTARVLQHEIDHLRGKMIIDYWDIWNRAKYRMGLLSCRGKKSRQGPSQTL